MPLAPLPPRALALRCLTTILRSPLLILRDPGAVSGGGKNSKRGRKKFRQRKVKKVTKTCNCPWVYENVLFSDFELRNTLSYCQKSKIALYHRFR